MLNLSPEEIKFLGSLAQATGTVVAAFIIGVAGALISRSYSRERDRQDKEAQWRSHAIELTKLDMQSKLATRDPKDQTRIRPSILNFLANYRDLQELGMVSPKDLYEKIIQNRINTKSNDPSTNTDQISGQG